MTISIELGQTAFRPGNPISGAVNWNDLATTTRIDVRLIWYTSGKGDADVAIVASESVANPADSGKQTFSFIAPGYPHSYSGRLVSVTWAIEVVAFPQKFAERKDLVIGPAGSAVTIQERP